MTGGFTQAVRTAMLNAAFPGSHTYYVGLFATAPTAPDAGDGAEAAVSGYARVATGTLTLFDFTLEGTGDGVALKNAADIVFGALGADLTVHAVGIFDAATAGNLLSLIPLGDSDGNTIVSQDFVSGDTPTLPAASLSFGILDVIE